MHTYFCLFFHFNLSYTPASVLSLWEQTFFTGIGKTIELVFLFSVAVPHSNCNDHGFESVFDENKLRLKEKCICIFLVGPCYEWGGAKSQSPLHPSNVFAPHACLSRKLTRICATTANNMKAKVVMHTYFCLLFCLCFLVGPVFVTRDQKHTDQYVSGCFVTPSRGTEINIELQTDRSVSAAACRAHLAMYRIHK